MRVIGRTIEIDAPIDRVFAFVTDIRNHPSVVPPETREQVLDCGDGPMRVGTIVCLRARYGGITWSLSSRIAAFDPPVGPHSEAAYFRDEQVNGPFAVWRHDHWFESNQPGITRLTDRFTFSAPLGPFGWLAEQLCLTRRMVQLLEHIHSRQKRLSETERE